MQREKSKRLPELDCTDRKTYGLQFLPELDFSIRDTIGNYVSPVVW